MHRVRRLLIKIGKSAPFVICFVVFVSYSETIYSLTIGRYSQFHDYTTLYKPISETIGNVFEYDSLTIFILSVLSIASETCRWYKIACVYLIFNLAVSDYAFSKELTTESIYAISYTKAAVSLIIVYKGMKKTLNG